MGDYLSYLTAAVYWLLILVWGAILIFYRREYRRLKMTNPLVATLLVVIFVDGARTLFESLYFGIWYTARAHLLPYSLYQTMSEPQWVIIPKGFNLIAALLIILIIIRGWFDSLEKETKHQRETEQLLSEVQLAHRELQELHCLRDDLTHMVVHDLRTPLTGVLGNLYTIQQTHYDPELLPEMVANSIRAGETLLTMVNDLLDINRLESGGRIQPEPVPARRLIQEAIDLVNPLVLEKHHTLSITLPEDDLNVMADRDIIRRVLVNLLGNAIKFTPSGGNIAINATKQDGIAAFSVSDTGKGIPKEIQDHIFEKFFHAQDQASTYQPSSGLGLAFCKLALEAHGGTIRVESEPYQGSTFTFTLPLVQRKA